MDVVQDEAGTWRVVELGDGQVSDRKAWAPADLAALIDGMRR
jgi:hypothetical protein